MRTLEIGAIGVESCELDGMPSSLEHICAMKSTYQQDVVCAIDQETTSRRQL